MWIKPWLGDSTSKMTSFIRFGLLKESMEARFWKEINIDFKEDIQWSLYQVVAQGTKWNGTNSVKEGYTLVDGHRTDLSSKLTLLFLLHDSIASWEEANLTTWLLAKFVVKLCFCPVICEVWSWVTHTESVFCINNKYMPLSHQVLSRNLQVLKYPQNAFFLVIRIRRCRRWECKVKIAI